MIGLTSQPRKSTTKVSKEQNHPQKPRHFKVISKTYKNNLDSDFTERIADLNNQFDYASNSDMLWGDPELSIFYGTPLYDRATETQRKGLNHLYWVAQYTHTANAEANTILYNQVTSGVFSHFSEYDTLCKELDFESEQEITHIKAFQKIGLKTKIALMGKESLLNPNTSNRKEWAKKRGLPRRDKLGKLAQSTTYALLGATNGLMHWDKRRYYSEYLQQKAIEQIPTHSGGLAGVSNSPLALKYLALSWGSSPFLAAQYYSARMIANMSLKAYEHVYFKRFQELQRKGEAIPIPTAVSHYHMLDEAFHTTLSQLISQELYRDFPRPNPYEKMLADFVIERLQRGLLGGLSGGMPVVFRDDRPFLDFYYRLLRSELFGMSAKDALYWLERILCEEHEGYHVNAKFHRNLLVAFQRFFGKLDYLAPMNREMQLMSRGSSLELALARNRESLKTFCCGVARSF